MMIPLDKYQSTKDERTQNYLRTVKFQNPKWIPCTVGIMPATWKKYREDVENIVLRHPNIFPDYRKGMRNFDEMEPKHRKGYFVDPWGCGWHNIFEGMTGEQTTHPLERWDALRTYKAPDTSQDDWANHLDWSKIRENAKKTKRRGKLARGGLSHGFMFMRLYYLRGFENLMIDFATKEPKLRRLIDMVLNRNMQLIKEWLKMGVELMYFGDDLGAQTSLPISPKHFRQYLKPCYAKMFDLCHDAGVLVYFHTDGHVLEVIDDLIECGIDIINPQVRANTLKGLAEIAKGKVCINLDLDRQLFPFAKPIEIKRHIKQAVDVLGYKKGGLMLYAECEPDVPLKNIETICEAFEEYGGPSA